MAWPSTDDLNWNTPMKAHILAGHNADGTHKLTEITEYKILALTRDMTGATGDVAYTGVGFQPRQVVFFGSVSNETAGSWGVDDGTTKNCSYQEDAGKMLSSITSSIVMRLGSNLNQHAFSASLDSDGFTLTWVKDGSPTGTATIIAICFK